MEQAPHGSGHGTELLEFKERLDNGVIYMVLFLGGAVWSQELYSMITVGPFQLATLYDCIKKIVTTVTEEL